MTRWTSRFALSLGLLALAMTPAVSHAGAMLKEHECVGKDTALNLAATAEDAGCTPIGSEILPPGGPLNEYGDEDLDEAVNEGFTPRGALEILPPGSNRWQTIPTIKEPGFRQVGFPASMSYSMYVKSSTVLSDIEVVCSVCAERPQNTGPGQTYVGFDDEPNGGVGDGDSEFLSKLNIAHEPWRLNVSHSCGGRNPLSGPGCGGPLDAKTLPGLINTMDDEVTFIGCKETVVLVENRGQFFQGDLLNVQIDVPAAARVHGNFDVTSCEASYIRGCLPGEGQFKDICNGEP